MFSELESEETVVFERKKPKKKVWKKSVSRIMRRLNTDVFSELESEKTEV